MKKILHLLTFSALLPVAAFSQITIQADDISLVGFSAVQSRDTFPDATIAPGGNGMQTWDFTGLKDQDRDSLQFYEASLVPFAGLFPGANVGATLDSFAYLFFDVNNDHIQTLGSYGTLEYGGFTVTANYVLNPPQTIIKFPMELNGAYTEVTRATIQITGDEIGQPSYDSIRLVTNSLRSVMIDAFGQLTTPVGNYETLRSSEVEISQDSFYILNNSIWFGAVAGGPDTTTIYNWWSNQNGLGFPVVQVEMGSNGLASQATWLNGFVSGTHSPESFVEIGISPNPASHFIHVNLPEGFLGKMKVYDMNGRQQMTANVNSTTEQLNLQQLVNGSFVLVLIDKNGKLAGFERFEVVR
jgi:Secretion system C-terminal sorting domain